MILNKVSLYFFLLVFLLFNYKIKAQGIDQISLKDSRFEYRLTESDIKGQGMSLGEKMIRVKGSINYIFKYLNPSDKIKISFNDDSVHLKKFELQLDFNSDEKNLSEKEFIDIYKNITSVFECTSSVDKELIKGHIIDFKNLESNEEIKLTGTNSKISADKNTWRGYRVSATHVTDFLSSYYNKFFKLEDKRSPTVFSIQIDKTKSLEENIVRLKEEYGIKISEEIFQIETYNSTDCQNF